MPRDRVGVAERRIRALTLRREAQPYDVIGRVLGISKTRAWGLVQEALSEHIADDVTLLRQLEGDRLDIAQVALWPAVLDGDRGAVDTFIRLSARRARLFGLDVVPDDVVVAIEMRQSYQATMDRMLRGIGTMLAEEAR